MLFRNLVFSNHFWQQESLQNSDCIQRGYQRNRSKSFANVMCGYEKSRHKNESNFYDANENNEDLGLKVFLKTKRGISVDNPFRTKKTILLPHISGVTSNWRRNQLRRSFTPVREGIKLIISENNDVVPIVDCRQKYLASSNQLYSHPYPSSEICYDENELHNQVAGFVPFKTSSFERSHTYENEGASRKFIENYDSSGRLSELEKLNRKLEEKIQKHEIFKLQNELSSSKSDFFSPIGRIENNSLNDEDLLKLVVPSGKPFHPDYMTSNFTTTGERSTVLIQKREILGHGLSSANEKKYLDSVMDKFNLDANSIQAQLGTLENFIHKNRALFPPNLVVHQVFEFQDKEMMKRHNGACKVKVKEKLLVPKGTDLSSYDIDGTLARCYHRNEDVEVCYEDGFKSSKVIKPSLDDYEKFEGSSRQDYEKLASQLSQDPDQCNYKLKVKDNYCKIDNDDVEIKKKNAELISENDTSSLSTSVFHYSTFTPPHFLAHLNSKKVVEGENFDLNCEVEGQAEVEWFKDNIRLSNGKRIRISSNYFESSSKHHFSLTECQPEDQGLYKVEATNKHGLSVTSAVVDVLLTNDKTLETRGDQLRFVRIPPTELKMFEGQPVTIRVQMEGGKQMPKIKWYKGMNELRIEDSESFQKIRLQKESSHQFFLQIMDLSQNDSALYSFLAHDGFSIIRTSVDLIVLQNKLEEKEVPNELVKLKPLFLKGLPLEHEAIQGQDLTIGCQVQKSEHPEIEVKLSEPRKSMEDDLIQQNTWNISASKPGSFNIRDTTPVNFEVLTLHKTSSDDEERNFETQTEKQNNDKKEEKKKNKLKNIRANDEKPLKENKDFTESLTQNENNKKIYEYSNLPSGNHSEKTEEIKVENENNEVKIYNDKVFTLM